VRVQPTSASRKPTSHHLDNGCHGLVLISAKTLPTHRSLDVQLPYPVAFFPMTEWLDFTCTQLDTRSGLRAGQTRFIPP